MSKIQVKMNSIYEMGKIRGYATAIIDNAISIRGIKVEQAGPEPTDVNVVMPNFEREPMFDVYSDEFTDALYQAVCSEYFTEIGVEAPELVEEIPVDAKNLSILVTNLCSPEDNPTLRGKVHVSIDDLFSINRVLVREKDGALEVEMPRRKTVEGYREIASLVTLNYENRFKDAVLEAYALRLERNQPILMEEEPSVAGNELKFFMPLRVKTCQSENDDGEYEMQNESFEIENEVLLGNEEIIRETLRNYESNLGSDYEERGLMAFYHPNDVDDHLSEKVQSLRFDIECVGDVVYGVAIVKLMQPITQADEENLKDFITGQASDGLGEGFEQRSTRVGVIEVEISLWNSETWSLQTADELGFQSMTGMDSLQ